MSEGPGPNLGYPRKQGKRQSKTDKTAKKFSGDAAYEGFLSLKRAMNWGGEQVKELVERASEDYNKFLLAYEALEIYYKAVKNHKPRELPADFARKERDILAEIVDRNSGLIGNAMKDMFYVQNRRYAGVLSR